MPASVPLTPSLENYLEVILSLEDENHDVRVTDLADKLHIAKSSVNQAITRLAKSNLVKYSKYSPIRLTAAGRKRALEIRRKHSLLKYFLETVLKVSPAIAEKEACLMEHVVGNNTINKLEKFIENLNSTEKRTMNIDNNTNQKEIRKAL